MNAITTQADVRTFYVKSDEALADYGRFVAEPPPDVFANFTESLALIAKASEAKGLGEAELQLLSKLTKEAVRLGVRSQGVLYLRDASYRLAEGFMNGAFLPVGRASQAVDGTTIDPPARQTAYETGDQVKNTQSTPADDALVSSLAGQGGLRGIPQGQDAMVVAAALRQNPRLLSATIEANNYRLAFTHILDNAKELIIKELELNPSLSTLPESTKGASTDLPRLAADFETKDSKTILKVTFTNADLGEVDIDIEVTALRADASTIESTALSARVGNEGVAKASWQLPADTAKVMIVAPTSTRLTKAVPSP